MPTTTPLRSARNTILVSLGAAALVTIAIALVLGEPLYYVAALLFVVAGVASVYVIRSLERKIGQGQS